MSKTIYETANEAIDILVRTIKRFDESPNDKCALVALDRAQAEVALKALHEYICKTENSPADEQKDDRWTTTIAWGKDGLNGLFNPDRATLRVGDNIMYTFMVSENYSAVVEYIDSIVRAIRGVIE